MTNHAPAPYAKFATIFENRVVVTQEPIDGRRHKFTVSEYHKNPTNEKYTGQISGAAQKKIDKKLHGWIYTMKMAKANRQGVKRPQKYQPILVTLTLPANQMHTDKVIKAQALELFIKRLQYHFDVKHYFWKAEKQDNGNIHFHCIFDRYIQKADISKHWNEVLKPLNYIDRFAAKHGHENPPSTNVKSLWARSANIWYLLKYVSKADKDFLIDGAVWRFSQSLKNVKPLKIMMDWQEAKKLRQFCRDKVERVFKDDFFAIVYFKRSSSLVSFFNSLGDVFYEVAEKCFKELYPPPTPHFTTQLQPIPLLNFAECFPKPLKLF